jgi:hypothetical protein
MKTDKLAFVLPGLLACMLPALNLHAQDTNSSSSTSSSSAPSASVPLYYPLTVGAEVGTLGVGGSGTFRFADHFGVSAGFDWFGIGYHATIKNTEYDVKTRLMGEPVALCLYPVANRSMHFKLGIEFNQNRITGTNPGGTFTVNGNNYPGTLNLNIQQQPISPYASFAGNLFYLDHAHHASVGAEVGCVFTGTPRVGLTSSNPAATADVDTARQQVIKYANYFRWIPIIKVGVNYSF